VGIIVSGVRKGLEAGHTWAKKNTTTTFLIACVKAKNTDITCRFDDKKQKLSDNTIAVTIARGTEPKDVKPFERVRICTWEHFCCRWQPACSMPDLHSASAGCLVGAVAAI
jgi:hypothetical protein